MCLDLIYYYFNDDALINNVCRLRLTYFTLEFSRKQLMFKQPVCNTMVFLNKLYG